MTVETATKVSQLNVSLPAAGDVKSEGDDHLRLIKTAILGTLTGADTTGVVGFNVVTQATTNNSTLAASTAYATAVAAIAAGAVNAQSALSVVIVSTTTQTATAGSQYVLTNVTASTLTLPASPASGDTVWITWTNSLTTNVVGCNGQTIMGVAGDMTLNALLNGTVQLRFVNSSWRIL